MHEPRPNFGKPVNAQYNRQFGMPTLHKKRQNVIDDKFRGDQLLAILGEYARVEQ